MFLLYKKSKKVKGQPRHLAIIYVVRGTHDLSCDYYCGMSKKHACVKLGEVVDEGTDKPSPQSPTSLPTQAPRRLSRVSVAPKRLNL